MARVRLIILMFGVVAIAFFLGLNVRATQQQTEPETVTLTVNVIGSGTVQGENFQCTGNCRRTYAKGSSVTLRVRPAKEWSFVGWEPACGQERTCTVVMDSTRNIVVIFTYP